MLSRKHRFHGRASIQRLYTNSKSVRSGYLALRYAPNPKRRDYRVAVVVSKKVSKSSVVRNRIRRRIYERVRILFASSNTVYDMLILAYDERVATLPSDVLDVEITKLIRKAGLTSADAAKHDILEARRKI